MELIVIIATSLLLVPIMTFTSGPLRIILGLVFVLLFPGYTLIAAFFPRKGDLTGIERLALSLGLSLAVVPLMGLGLNYTPWGIRLYPILISLLLFIVATAAISLFRRRKLPREERFDLQFRSRLGLLFRSAVPHGRWDKLLTLVLVASIIGAVGTLGYVIVKPKSGERFTEFYLLDSSGKAEDYPRQLASGDAATVTVGIINREGNAARYRLEVRQGDVILTQVNDIVLSSDQSWERGVEFSLTGEKGKQKVDFWLYRDSVQPYRSLYLWVEVK